MRNMGLPAGVDLAAALLLLPVLLHTVVSEQNPVRKFLLFIFARYIEVPLLKFSYYFLKGKWSSLGSRRWFRYIASRFLARPLGYLGDTGKPVPLNDVLSYIEKVDGPIAVGPCRCRIGHKACSHPLETDIVIRTGFKAWTRAFPKDYREISRDEAKKIVTMCHKLNMFHMVFIHCPVNLYNEYAICNCCTCGCVPYIINRELTQLYFPLIDGYFIAETKRRKCKSCKTCVEICPFDARQIVNGKSKTENNCFGCGLCFYNCPEKAISLKKLKDPMWPRDTKGHHLYEYRPSLYKQHAPYREE